MNDRNLNHSRRRFIEFVGKSGLSTSALKGSSVLAGLMAHRYAQASNKVKRVVFVFTPMGAPPAMWLPDGNKLKKATQAFEGFQPVCHFHQTNVVDGGFTHIRKSMAEIRWTKDWTSDTIDHQIASVLGITTPFNSLHFGVQTGIPEGSFEGMSARAYSAVVPLENPSITYARLFGSSDSRHPDKKIVVSRVLDANLEALNCQRAKLSAEEGLTIEKYQHELTQLQQRVSNTDSAKLACPVSERSFPESSTFLEEAYLQAEIISQTLACGLTNVVTLQLSDDQGNFVGSDPEFTGGVHGAACGGGHQTKYPELINDLSGCIAHLIGQLAAQDDPAAPGTKLLDNTVVVQVTQMGDGPNHEASPAPSVIATRLPEFKTGLVTPYRRSSSNLRILQTVAAGLGLEQYIGKESHHCIWPCGDAQGGVDTSFLT